MHSNQSSLPPPDEVRVAKTIPGNTRRCDASSSDESRYYAEILVGIAALARLALFTNDAMAPSGSSASAVPRCSKPRRASERLKRLLARKPVVSAKVSPIRKRRSAPPLSPFALASDCAPRRKIAAASISPPPSHIRFESAQIGHTKNPGHEKPRFTAA